MEAIKRAARKFWGWSRRQRLWVQIVLGLLVASVIFGPIIEATDKGDDKQEQSQDTAAPTTSVRPTTVPTAAASTTVAPTTTRPAPTTTLPAPSTTTTIPLTSFTGLNPSRIFAKDFNPWPFSVETGLLGCPEGSAVVFATDGPDGAIWAINGTARTIAERRGWKNIQGSSLWLDSSIGPGAKVDIGKVLDYGQTLCG